MDISNRKNIKEITAEDKVENNYLWCKQNTYM